MFVISSYERNVLNKLEQIKKIDKTPTQKLLLNIIKMNWLARYRDNYEQETKDLIADLDQAIKDQKYPKTDQQL